MTKMKSVRKFVLTSVGATAIGLGLALTALIFKRSPEVEVHPVDQSLKQLGYNPDDVILGFFNDRGYT